MEQDAHSANHFRIEVLHGLRSLTDERQTELSELIKEHRLTRFQSVADYLQQTLHNMTHIGFGRHGGVGYLPFKLVEREITALLCRSIKQFWCVFFCRITTLNQCIINHSHNFV